MPRQAFLTLPNPLKDFALLGAVVVDEPVGALPALDLGQLADAGNDWPRQRYAAAVEALRKRGFRIDRFAHKHIAGRVESDVDGVLAFSIPFAPGWSVQVDGNTVPVFRANLGMLAVELPRGSHAVELRHSQPGIGAGWGLAALGMLAWPFVLRVVRRSSPQPRPRDD